MENAKDEDYFLLIPNPITEEKDEFDFDTSSNVSLVMRLIRKRERLVRKMSSKFDTLDRIREERGVDKIEDDMKRILNDIREMDADEFDSNEDYESKISDYEDDLDRLSDLYPKEVVTLQNETGKLMENIDRVGVKICSIVLNPVKGVPLEYNSKMDFIEEYISSDQDVQDVITFFLSTLNSSTKSLNAGGIQMKKRSDNEKS